MSNIAIGESFLNSSWLYSLTNNYTGPNGYLSLNPSSASALTFNISLTAPTLFQFCTATDPAKYNICTMVTGSNLCIDIVSGQTRVPHLAVPASDTGQDWTISNWGDGTYMMVNDYSGPDLHLDVFADTKGGQLDTGDHTGQHWSFHQTQRAAPDQICNHPAAPSSPSNQPVTIPDPSPGAQEGIITTSTIVATACQATQTHTSDGQVSYITSNCSAPNASSSSISNHPPQTPQSLAAPETTSTTMLNTGAYVGIAIGVAIPLVSILLVVVWFLRRRRQQEELYSESGMSRGHFPAKGFYADPSIHSVPDPYSEPVSAIEEIIAQPSSTYDREATSSPPGSEASPVETEGRMIHKHEGLVELPGQEWI